MHVCYNTVDMNKHTYWIFYLCSLNLFINVLTDDMSGGDVPGKNYMGKLSGLCVEKYRTMFLQRAIPPRWYRYFHEEEEAKRKESGSFEDTDLNFRIIGGDQIEITQAPYAVLYGPYCGGSLIAPEWVLTAAHCRTRETYIIAGATKYQQGTMYPICAHFLHPLWGSKNKTHFHDYDYQLVLLERPVPVTANSRPIAIGNLQDILSGTMITVSGWGHTQMKQKTMQDYLSQVSIPIMPFEECQSLSHQFYKTITPRMFCAGYRNGTKDSCQGDSGGPAMINNKLVGLVSFGVGCAEPDHPGVYSVIPLARPWIREITGLPL